MVKNSDRVIEFLRTLKLPSAEWYGKPFEPLPWFKDVIRGIYDNVDSDGYRIVKEAFIEIPRKNAKSVSIAGLALYHALMDGEEDGQIYIVATDTSNASVIFDMLKTMIYQNKILSKIAKVIEYRKEIIFEKTQYTTKSKIKAMSSEDSNKHGLSPSLCIYDELHTARNRELYDVMQTGMGARRQPLMIAITTAGANTHCFCYDQYLYAKDVLAGIIENPSFYAYIREIPQDADWKDPENWKKANPSWGITVKPEYIQAQFEKAQHQLSAENNFRRLYCNQWVEQAERWLSMDVWNKQIIESDTFPELDLTGEPCYLGMDLSAIEDMTSIVQVFKYRDNYILKPHFFLPLATIEHHRNSELYKKWEMTGELVATPGTTINYDWVADYIEEISKKNPINIIGYDPWNATQLLLKLEEKGFNTVEYQQRGKIISSATKEFERLLKSGNIWHYNHSILNWNVNNVKVEEDRFGNLRISKPDGKSYAKIDGIAASIMGCDLASRLDENPYTVYETKDILIL